MLTRDMPIHEFTMRHYDRALALWSSEANVGLSSADDRDAIGRFLIRNPGLSKVVFAEAQMIGTILCGHDGRRGYIYHLYVHPEHRRGGVGTALVDACLGDLRRERIHKCHLFIFNDNQDGKRFWAGISWKQRGDIGVFSRDI